MVERLQRKSELLIQLRSSINLLSNLCLFYRVYENGVETIFKYENDVLKSKTVNGVPQAITHN